MRTSARGTRRGAQPPVPGVTARVDPSQRPPGHAPPAPTSGVFHPSGYPAAAGGVVGPVCMSPWDISIRMLLESMGRKRQLVNTGHRGQLSRVPSHKSPSLLISLEGLTGMETSLPYVVRACSEEPGFIPETSLWSRAGRSIHKHKVCRPRSVPPTLAKADTGGW